MKIYTATELFICEYIVEEITTKVFTNREDAQKHFDNVARQIKNACINNFGKDAVFSEDVGGGCVYQLSETVCDAWKSFSASEWEWMITLETHEV